MKKALLVIAAVAILGIMAAYVNPLGPENEQSATASTTDTNATTASTGTPSGNGAAPTPSTTTTTPSTGITQTSGLKDGNYQGSDYSGPYGDVQVTVSIQNGKITNINFDQLTAYDRESRAINNDAAPQLKSQTLAAQSAHIDGVSGATYTSTDYIRSLQSALDKARG